MITPSQAKIKQATLSNKKGIKQIFGFSIKYPMYENFVVNKQFDNKNYCIVNISPNGSESVLGLFKTKKAAIAFGTDIGLKLAEKK